MTPSEHAALLTKILSEKHEVFFNVGTHIFRIKKSKRTVYLYERYRPFVGGLRIRESKLIDSAESDAIILQLLTTNH